MPVPSVDPQTLRQWLVEGSAALVDVREPAEYRASRIAGARLMPLSSVAAADLPAGKVVIHCQKGGRGNTACETLLKQNPSLEIYNLAGGLEGWSAAGLPLERGGGLSQ
jgi:rhodanese-related sulfurtransferase